MTTLTTEGCLVVAIDQICNASNAANANEGIPVIGISGPQGSGKTTALNALNQESDKRIATLGIDDFYLTKAQRTTLAKEVSPLFKTRGPAGTHDVAQIEETLSNLRHASSASITPLIKFNKVTDDRKPQNDWASYKGKPDVIILEGWLVGAIAPEDFASSPSINAVESRDQGNVWRQYQKNQLDTVYAKLWRNFDAFIHIQGPGFGTVFNWRKQQEASNLGVKEAELTEQKISWLSEFIQYYERLTVAMEKGSRCEGDVIAIDQDRGVLSFDQRHI